MDCSTAGAPLVIALPGAEHIAEGLQRDWPCELGRLTLHRFPDEECCPRFAADLTGRDVVLVACLDRPDAKLFALYLSARTARELGAASVGLVLPYLPYMRQDKRFQPGEGTSARHMAELLSSCADWLATVDPHLHRLSDLESVFRIPALAVSSAAPLAQWIARHVRQPLIVGPDSESAQWVANVAGRLGCPFLVMEKQRSGDRMVTVSLNGASVPHGYTPVLLDDIASSGHTLARAVRALRASGTAPPVCAIVHGVFAGDALEVLHRAGPAQVVSCNTVLHPSNQVDITQALAEAAALLALGVRNREVAAS